MIHLRAPRYGGQVRFRAPRYGGQVHLRAPRYGGQVRLRAPRVGGPNRIAAIAAALIAAVGIVSAQGRAGAPVHGYEVVNVYPHDRNAFTQGLLFRDGVLYESTGLRGQSSLRKVQLETGKVLQQISVDKRYFAEGLAGWGSRLVQLTWDTNVGFVYDLTSFKQLQTFSYTGQGWGLTHDGRQLIMSDGTATLRFLDPQTFAVRRQVPVTDGGIPVRDLNELEFIDGQVYANVWLTDRIAIIAPDSG